MHAINVLHCEVAPGYCLAIVKSEMVTQARLSDIRCFVTSNNNACIVAIFQMIVKVVQVSWLLAEATSITHLAKTGLSLILLL